MSEKLKTQRVRMNPTRKKGKRFKRNVGAEPSFNIRMAQTRRGADHYNSLTKPRAYDDPLDALDEFPGDRIARERAAKERKRRRAPARPRSSKRRKRRAPATARAPRRTARGGRPGRGSAFVVELLKQTGRRLQFFYVTGKSLLASRARAKRFATEKEAIAAARCAIKGKSAQYRYARVLKA